MAGTIGSSVISLLIIFTACVQTKKDSSDVYHSWTENGSEDDSKICTDPHSSYGGAGCDKFEPDDMEFESIYYVGFLKNYRRRNSRKIYLLSKSVPVLTSIQVMRMGSPTEPLEGEIEPLKYTTLELPVEDFAISQINATPDCSIEVIGVNEEFKSVDAFCSIPVDPGIPQEYIAVSLATDPHYTGQHDGVIQIIGSQDGTSVDIVLSVDASIVGGKNASYYERDKTHSIIVDKYETLTITSAGDLTGTRITSSSGLSVFSGHECRFTESDPDCRVGECDILVEQLPPTSIWGTEYILSPFLGRTTGSRVKVVAARANTVINIQCYSMNHDKTVPDKVVTIGSGESYHFILQRSSYCRVSSINQPILVAQFSMARENEDIGAPFMLLVPDVDKSLRNVSFISIDTTDHRFHHFVTVVIKGRYLDTPVMIDGSPIVLEDSSHQALDFGSNLTYLVIRMSVGGGYHHLQHGMFGRVFGLMVYGFTRDASYGYSMGYHQVAQCDPEN